MQVPKASSCWHLFALLAFAGIKAACKMLMKLTTGRKKPSQSPSMWLLGRTYIRKEGEDEEEGKLKL